MHGDSTTTEAPAVRGPAVLSLSLALVAAALVVSGERLLSMGGRGPISAGVLLLVAALGAASVAAGSTRFGPSVEGPLDLSARLGLGVLGGVLAALVHGLLTVLAGGTGLVGLLGSGVDAGLGAADWGSRLSHGATWGFLLGLLWRYLPGADPVRKGLVFSLLLSAYVLLVRFPFFESVGFFGLGLGIATLFLVLIGNAVAGVVAASVIGWGARTPERPVSRALVP